MTVPGRVEAASLLLSLDPRRGLIRHSRAVAEVAGWLAARIAARGIPVDRSLVEAAGLLHDVDEALPADDPARGLPHGHGSAAWVTARGHPELGPAIASHPVVRLLDAERAERWLASAPIEDRIVAYADKRAAKHLAPMDARFARWRRRYGDWAGADGAQARLRADRLEADVCAAAGVPPCGVRRLRWTARAFEAARPRP
jgi:predicted hydrolase (HD superfamily)